MPLRPLVLGSIVLLLCCWYFVESPLPRYQPGDVVALHGKPQCLVLILAVHTPVPVAQHGNGQLRLVEWEYIAAFHDLQCETFVIESHLEAADPQVVTQVLQLNARYPQLAAFAWD